MAVVDRGDLGQRVPRAEREEGKARARTVGADHTGLAPDLGRQKLDPVGECIAGVQIAGNRTCLGGREGGVQNLVQDASAEIAGDDPGPRGDVERLAEKASDATRRHRETGRDTRAEINKAHLARAAGAGEEEFGRCCRCDQRAAGISATRNE